MGNKIVRQSKMRPTKGKAGIKGFTWDIYAIAFVITCIVFLTGVYIGQTLVKSELNTVHNEIISTEADSSLMQIILMNKFSGNDDNKTDFNCAQINLMANDLESKTWTIGKRLTDIENSGKTDNVMKTEYMILEYRNYLISKLINHRCNESTNTILYFYSNKPNDCKTCEKEGQTLTDFRDEMLKDNESIKIKIYSFDASLKSQIINILKSKYNITEYPTLIINGKERNGFTSKDVLTQYVSK